MRSRDHDQGDFPLIETVVGSIADWVDKYRRSMGGELSGCDPDEVMAVANELGVSPRELESLSRKGTESIPLLQKMLAALHVDQQALIRKDPEVVRDLQRLCTACRDQRRCQHELDAGTAAAHFHDFCPNAFTLDALTEQVAAASKS